VLPDNFGQTIQVEKQLCYCPSLQVFSYMKESMLVRTTLEALVSMKGYFNPFEIKRYKLTSLFHPNLMPNLEETKITYSWG
jgi:predicted glycosyltransferase